MIHLLIIAFFSSQSLFASLVDEEYPSTPYNPEISYNDDQMNLTWIGSGDDGRDGQAQGYLLRWGQTPIQSEDDWNKANVIEFVITSDKESKLIKASTKNIKIGAAGYISIRAFDEAKNFSAIAESLYFKWLDPFISVEGFVTKSKEESLALGYEADGKDLFACIGLKKNDLVPGKMAKHLGSCHIALEKEDQTNSFRYLIRDENYIWLNSSQDWYPHAIRMGSINEIDAFICRTKFAEGVHLGYVIKGSGCHFGYSGKKMLSKVFEILGI